MERPQLKTKEILARLAIEVRKFGFKGSGQNFRKAGGDFIFVINFWKTRWGDEFFINLGAQPIFIPTEGESAPDPKKLKEYECVFRRRVVNKCRWTMDEDEIKELIATLNAAQKDFFEKAQQLRTAVETDPPEVLLRDFKIISITTDARVILHLARACAVLGQPEKASSFVSLGLELAGNVATTLRAQLKSVLSSQPPPSINPL